MTPPFGHVAGTTLRSIRAVWQGQLMDLPHGRCAAKTWAMGHRGAKLTAQQRGSLERDGYLVVTSLLTEAVIGRMTGRVEELVRKTVAAWEAHRGPDIVEPGVVRAKLGMADPDFAPCMEAAIWYPRLGPGPAAALKAVGRASGL